MPAARVEFEQVDLASIASIARLTETMASRHEQIDLLINNAGMMTPPKRLVTQDGFELQFGTNHLGHFALTGRLMPLLRQADGPA
jgi:NAD(P)-dependent dehydrogenase (short-subunit alcohol dehydrogenase family)